MDKQKLMDMAKANMDNLQDQWNHRDEYITEVSKQTNSLLDNLDKDLETIENRAKDTLKEVTSSLSSWWTAYTKEENPKTPVQEHASTKTGEKTTIKYSSFITNGDFNTRVVSELQTLESSVELYKDGNRAYQLTEPEAQELESLKSQPDLILLDTLKAFSGDETEFWNLYFSKRNEIIKQDETRKKVLKSKENDDEDEDFNWDEDE